MDELDIWRDQENLVYKRKRTGSPGTLERSKGIKILIKKSTNIFLTSRHFFLVLFGLSEGN